MSSARRRTRTGIPVAVFVAIFAAALSWRSSHRAPARAEFPGASVGTYLSTAQELRDAPVSATVLEVRRRAGVLTRVDRSDSASLAVNRDGTIRTFFRPNVGEAYFSRQASRTPGGGS